MGRVSERIFSRHGEVTTENSTLWVLMGPEAGRSGSRTKHTNGIETPSHSILLSMVMRHFSKNNTLFWRKRTEKKRRRKWKERWERVRSRIRVGGRRYSKITRPIWRLFNLYNTRTLTEIGNFSNQYVILTVFYLIKAFKLLSQFLANITRKSSFTEYKKKMACCSQCEN